VQEEAPSLGKPVLVVRETTERPEAIEAGVAQLAGTDPEALYAAVTSVLDDAVRYESMANAVSPFGDGRAAIRVARRLLADLDEISGDCGGAEGGGVGEAVGMGWEQAGGLGLGQGGGGGVFGGQDGFHVGRPGDADGGI
jgi:hypothetical protein